MIYQHMKTDEVRHKHGHYQGEAAYSRRYARPSAACRGASGRYSRSWWRGVGSLDLVRLVPVLTKALCRRRISGADLSKGFGQDPATPRNRNRQTFRPGQGLRNFAPTVGCRTHLRLAEPMPPVGQGFRKSHPKCTRFSPPRLDPPLSNTVTEPRR